MAILILDTSARWLRNRKWSQRSMLKRALVNNKLSVRYQPIVNVSTGMWVGAEALVRWNNHGQDVSPQNFIPLVEQSSDMRRFTRWVCERVVADYSKFMWACDNIYISINLSAQDVIDPTFPVFIQKLLKKHQLPACYFVFEVTESVVLDKAAAIAQLDLLRAQGHRIALDDFGSGYSSLAYVDSLPLDILKIDRSFVGKLEGGSESRVFLMIVDLAKSLKLSLIVEGVELDAQVQCLKALGIPTAQGWFYSRDLAPDELVRGYFSLDHPEMDRVI